MQKLGRFARKGARVLIHRVRTQGVKTTLIWVYGRGFSKLTGIPLRRYSQITPEVFIGGQYGRRGKNTLEHWGVNGVVNLRTEFDDAAHGLALEHYCHLPTIDDAAPTLDNLQAGADFIQRVIDGGGKVYLHCAGGVGRAPTQAAAYFITQGLTLDEALALIRKVRPFINIMPPQMAQLEQFETLVREDPRMRFALSISTHSDAEQPERGFDFLRYPYVPYLQKLDILPILVPNHLPDPAAYLTALGVDGLVLTGGGDIAPERYGQPNIASAEITPPRDQTEYDLLEWAVEQDRPVLGICRGIQMLNVFFGGGLVQDIPSQLHSPVKHNDGDPHDIRITDPRVAEVIGVDEMRVNTHHHQGITADLLAAPLEAFAFCAADGVIEGVLHREKPILGVQWHPERPTPSLDYDLRLLRRFLQGAFWLSRP